MVSESVVKAMMELSALSFVLPFAMMVFWQIKYKKSVMPALTGALVFVTFGGILKSVPNMFFFQLDNPVSRFIRGNIWGYALCAGLLAGLFEETGRFVAFKLLLKQRDNRETAIAYGLGHGGIECMIVLGFSMLQNFTYAQVINAGQMEKMIGTLEDESSKEIFRELQEAIINLSVQDCIWAGVERVSAMVLQVSLSVLVFYSVKTINKTYFLAIAIALHSFIDVFAAYNQHLTNGSLPGAAFEIIILVYSMITAVFARKIYLELPRTERAGASKKDWKYARAKYKDKEGEEDGTDGTP